MTPAPSIDRLADDRLPLAARVEIAAAILADKACDRPLVGFRGIPAPGQTASAYIRERIAGGWRPAPSTSASLAADHPAAARRWLRALAGIQSVPAGLRDRAEALAGTSGDREPQLVVVPMFGSTEHDPHEDTVAAARAEDADLAAKLDRLAAEAPHG
jgi:hypothetical protein